MKDYLGSFTWGIIEDADCREYITEWERKFLDKIRFKQIHQQNRNETLQLSQKQINCLVRLNEKISNSYRIKKNKEVAITHFDPLNMMYLQILPDL